MSKTHDDDEDNDNMKMSSTPPLPNLFENYGTRQEKSTSPTEFTFEQLCSLRANDYGSGPVTPPFKSLSSSFSMANDEVEEAQDEF